MRPRMPYCGLRYIMQTISPVDCAPAEIHILEPNGKKAFVKTPEFLPDRPPNHQKRSRRLFHFHRAIVVQIQCTIPAVDGIVWPYPIQQESFQNECGWCWQPSHHESGLRPAAWVQHSSPGAGCTWQIAGLAQVLQSTNQHRIWI